MVAGSLFGGPPDEDSKRKARATLDQLRDKGLVEKGVLADEYGQFTVYWPVVDAQVKGAEGPEANRNTEEEWSTGELSSRAIAKDDADEEDDYF
jgi:hypothetical protein